MSPTHYVTIRNAEALWRKASNLLDTAAMMRHAGMYDAADHIDEAIEHLRAAGDTISNHLLVRHASKGA